MWWKVKGRCWMNSIKQYMKFVKPYGWQIVWTILIGVLKFAIPLLIPLILKYVIDNIIEGDMAQAAKTTRLLWLMGISFTIFLILRPPIEYARQYLAQLVASRILYDIRNKIFDHLQRLSLNFYSNTKTGSIISRVIHDVEQTKEFVVTGLMNVWLDIVTIIIVIIIMITIYIKNNLFNKLKRLSLNFYSNTKTGSIISRVIHDVEQTKEFVVTGLMNVWLDIVTILIAIIIMLTMDIKLTIVSIILFPLFGFAVKYFYGRLRELTRQRSQALAEVQGHLHERVQGFPVTKSFALED